MNDKRNPSLIKGDGESSGSYLRRIEEYLSRVRWQSEGHRLWYTHKNPSGCWICELFQIADNLYDEVMDLGGDRADSGEEQGDDLEEEF